MVSKLAAFIIAISVAVVIMVIGLIIYFAFRQPIDPNGNKVNDFPSIASIILLGLFVGAVFYIIFILIAHPGGAEELCFISKDTMDKVGQAKCLISKVENQITQANALACPT